MREMKRVRRRVDYSFSYTGVSGELREIVRKLDTFVMNSLLLNRTCKEIPEEKDFQISVP
jgi:hypothetical protein